MTVRLANSAGFEMPVFLKLYDRRFAEQLRRDEKIPPWTFKIEQEYQDYALRGNASNFIAKFRSDPNMAEAEGEKWSNAQNEAYLYNYMQKLYDTETEVYRRLKDMQGKDVPRLIARVKLPGCTPSPIGSNANCKYIDCPGILLDLIEGFPLTDLATHAPREIWQNVCEEAIRIVNTIGDRGIRNEDVKTRSFVVNKNSVNARFNVVMLDFASCQLRRPDQGERDWMEWKALQDEEGAVGYVMQKNLKGGFKYHRSAKYMKLDAEFKSE